MESEFSRKDADTVYDDLYLKTKLDRRFIDKVYKILSDYSEGKLIQKGMENKSRWKRQGFGHYCGSCGEEILPFDDGYLYCPFCGCYNGKERTR